MIVGVWDPTDAGTQPRGKQVRKPGGIFYTPTHRHLADRLAGAGAAGAASSCCKIVPDVDNDQIVRVMVTGDGTRRDAQRECSAIDERTAGDSVDGPESGPSLPRRSRIT